MPETELAPLVPYLEGPGGLKLTLPNGVTVVGKVLPLARATHYLRLQAQRDSGTGETQWELADKIVAEFPKDVGLEKELDQLTIGEFWVVFWAFFALRVSPTRGNGTPALTGPVS